MRQKREPNESHSRNDPHLDLENGENRHPPRIKENATTVLHRHHLVVIFKISISIVRSCLIGQVLKITFDFSIIKYAQHCGTFLRSPTRLIISSSLPYSLLRCITGACSPIKRHRRKVTKSKQMHLCLFPKKESLTSKTQKNGTFLFTKKTNYCFANSQSSLSNYKKMHVSSVGIQKIFCTTVLRLCQSFCGWIPKPKLVFPG